MPLLRSSAPPATRVDLGAVFREQARWCQEASAPLYAELLRGMADDWDARGVVHEICAGWEALSGTALVQIRLLAGLHDLVLSGAAPQLAPFYRSVGGERAADGAWPVARAVLAAHVPQVRDALHRVPQTNEVGRSAGLAAGLVTAAAWHGARRIRLLQLGASAGLHLLVDRFRVEGDGWVWGPADSPVQLRDAVHGSLGVVPPGRRPTISWRGRDRAVYPPHDVSSVVEIVERRGCDVAPVDTTTEAGRRRLQSFVWPDHADRYRRLSSALEVAARHPVQVDQADAGDWLEARLAEPQPDGVLTVVWNAVFLPYLDFARQARIGSLLAAARSQVDLVHVSLESPGSHYLEQPVLKLDSATLGTSAAHGLPLRLRDVSAVSRVR